MEERDKATNDKTRHEKNQTNIKNTRFNNTASKPSNNNNNSDINKNSAPRKQAMEPASAALTGSSDSPRLQHMGLMVPVCVAAWKYSN